uniref:EOG090X07YB n=1 Tax=Lynceus sp. MCZ IZ 141354 TaxID=1930659 RepID=A0A9N6WT48_9CRUS|nr:EOG090X07YB [Lynceus sp. MCZ IZ 141354]
MLALLLFSSKHELLFNYINQDFLENIHKFLPALSSSTKYAFKKDDNLSTRDTLIQLLSPLLTSQRVLIGEFGNSLNLVKCQNDINISFTKIFDEMIVGISNQKPQAELLSSVGAQLITHCCGPCVNMLNDESHNFKLVTHYIETWLQIRRTELTVCLEAINYTPPNTNQVLQYLHRCVGQLQHSHKEVHTVMFSGCNIVASYSSSSELKPKDLLMLAIYINSQRSLNTTIHSLVLEDGTPCSVYVINHSIFKIVVVLPVVDSEKYRLLFSCLKHMSLETIHTTIVNIMKGFKRGYWKDLGHALLKKFDQLDKENEFEIDTFISNTSNLFTSVFQGTLENTEMIDTKSLDHILSKLPEITLKNFGNNSVLQDFEGLIHFLVIDRNENVMWGSDTDFGFWKAIVGVGLSYLYKGHSHLQWHDSDMRYTHQLVFYSQAFNSFETYIFYLSDFYVQTGLLSGFVELKNTSGLKSGVLQYPGIIGNNFYSDLMKMGFDKRENTTLHCYQVFCAHLGSFPRHVVEQHTNKLVEKFRHLHQPSFLPLVW